MTHSNGSAEIRYVKSTASGPTENCVEAGIDSATGLIAVRHSKRTGEPPLLFSASEWTAFVSGVQAGEFDPDRLPR